MVGDGMTDRNQSREWDDIDTSKHAEQFTEFLETVTGAEAIQAYKRRSHRLLRPADGDRILDVGCGTGDDVLMLAERVGSDGEVVGIDNSETMVETAREQGRDVPMARFEIDDARDLSFADDSFDAARADRVLQHLEAPAEALAELRRVTRPWGASQYQRSGLGDEYHRRTGRVLGAISLSGTREHAEPDHGTAVISACQGGRTRRARIRYVDADLDGVRIH